MAGGKKEEVAKDMAKLEARQPTGTVLSVIKKLSIRSMAWIGVYLLGYFDFSFAWMITPLLLRYNV